MRDPDNLGDVINIMDEWVDDHEGRIFSMTVTSTAWILYAKDEFGRKFQGTATMGWRHQFREIRKLSDLVKPEIVVEGHTYVLKDDD